MNKSRLEAFSDAVIAIIITLKVLKLSQGGFIVTVAASMDRPLIL